MSQEFFDPELFADFIAEAKEHLETIEPNLLELEKAPDNLALLNDIFRPMHSLKGASGFLGLNRINQLAHKSENILDELRKGTMVVTSEIMDVILASTDALRQMIDNLESTNAEGDVEIEHIMAQIDAIMAGETAPTVQPDPAEAAPAEEAVAEATLDAEPAYAEADEQAEELAEEQTPADASGQGNNAANGGKQGDGGPAMSGKDWVLTLPEVPSYTLTAFGEGHLKDFIDESNDTIENLTNALLDLEENPIGRDELVNDIFRFFHNMKGNSGIIGYPELNALTHEAETLLNNVRQGKITPTHELIDLLLLVVDVLEALVQRINIEAGSASPFIIDPVVTQLQQAQTGGPISLPKELLEAQANQNGADQHEAEETSADDAPAEEHAPVEVVMPTIIAVGTENEDIDAFSATVRQQFEIIHAGLETLKKDGTHKESIDALYRCLMAVKSACAFMEFEEIKSMQSALRALWIRAA